MTREPDDAMARLNRLGEANPDPIVIVPATPDPRLDDGAETMAVPVEPHDPFPPTVAQPAPVATGSRLPVGVVPAAVLPAPFPPEPPARPTVWAAIIAGAVALVVGGIIGFLIGDSSDVDTKISSGTTVAPSVPGTDPNAVDQAVVDQRVDDILTLLLAQAQQNGSVVVPTPFPKLDQLLALAPGATAASTPATGVENEGQAVIDDLTAERDQLAAQVATLEDRVSSVEAERDALQATLDSGAGDQQSGDQTARIAELEGQLETANDNLAKANDDLDAVRADLDAANATLDALDVQPLEDVVGSDIDDVRELASANGWQLVEGGEPGPGNPTTVITQQPAVGTNMVKGSVLYVEVGKGK